jgi:nucleotide-binding universal stress UspA family protein
MKPFRHILLATDFSTTSNAAWKRGLALARDCGARMLLVHVMPSLAQAQAVRWAYQEMEAQVRKDAQRRLAALLARARESGVRARALLLSGMPAHAAIARAARVHRADLVIVGTHGHTGVVGALIGSVAARIVATAPCPVMTVRGRSRR